MTTKNLTVTIVIPNWNGKALLERHLPGILEASDDAEIIVVDDASDDVSVQFLSENYPKIKIINKNKHEGYASTINLGVQHARADIVVLLNSDVEPEKGFLKPLLRHFSDPNVFAVGCMDKSIENGKTTLRGRGIASWINGFYIHKRGEVDKMDTAWVSGGSGAFRKRMWEQLHGMDPLFNPFYWEDIDLSYRAIEKNYRLVFEPKSIVTHYHEKGKILTTYKPKEVLQISYRNQFLFIWKHVKGIQIVKHLFWMPVRIFQSISRGEDAMVLGFVKAILFLPDIFRYRVKNISL